MHLYQYAAIKVDTLFKIQHNHLTDEDLKTLNIECTDLDLHTGEPADGSEKFISPFPTDRIHAILGQTKPWLQYKIYPDEGHPRADAMAILNTLVGYLRYSEDGPALIEETDWTTRDIEYEQGEILFRHEGWLEWDVTCVLESLDDSIPHVTCLLADKSPVKDGHISYAEIWCILTASLYRWQCLWESCHDRIIPVTIISCSKKKLRIVQGYVDAQGRIQIRKSPALDFKGAGVYCKKGKMVDQQNSLHLVELVLSWCMGSPVGCTRIESQIPSIHAAPGKTD